MKAAEAVDNSLHGQKEDLLKDMMGIKSDLPEKSDEEPIEEVKTSGLSEEDQAKKDK